MKPTISLLAGLALSLAFGLFAAPASAGSRTAESTSHRSAITGSMEGVPRDAANRRTDCLRFGPSTHYRCTTTWDD